MPQNLLQHQTSSSDTILDLRGLAEPDLLIIDRSGKEWPIPSALPLRTALELVALAQSAGPDASGIETQVDGLLTILRLLRPQTQRDEILDAFSLPEMQRLVEWVTFRLAGQAQSNGSAAQPASLQQTNRQERRAATRTQKSSPQPSAAET